MRLLIKHEQITLHRLIFVIRLRFRRAFSCDMLQGVLSHNRFGILEAIWCLDGREKTISTDCSGKNLGMRYTSYYGYPENGLLISNKGCLMCSPQ
jgi:hypothetical protein